MRQRRDHGHRALSATTMNKADRSAATSVPTALLAKASLAALILLLVSPIAHAQPVPIGDPPGPPPAIPTAPRPTGPTGPTVAPPGSEPLAKDWSGAVRVLRVPGAAGIGPAEAKAAAEIFPNSNQVWMHVYGTDPRPVEAARRGAREWICSSGCQLTVGEGGADDGASPGQSSTIGDAMLRSIKIQTPTQPLPLTIWRPQGDSGGELLFDPSVLGRRSFNHICAYSPVTKRAKTGDEVRRCPQQAPPERPTPDSAAMRLGFLWPRTSELATFEYIAIADTCGNARVQPFQRLFNVPVMHVATGGCGAPDGRVLRVFPAGGWLRVTAFNLDTPAAGNVVSATFRVNVPPLEDLVSDKQPRLLFPDPVMGDLTIDCGPMVLKARRGKGGIPRRGPGLALPGQKAPPGKSLPGQKAPPGKSRPGAGKPKPPGPVAPKPRIVKPRILPASSPSAQPLAHQGLVIGPEPLLRGNCRIRLGGQQKRRLLAPLALRVKITRTDKVQPQQELLNVPWIVTPNDSTYHIKPLNIDGESRLRVEVFADPKNSRGNVILMSDAGRIARDQGAMGDEWQRLIGSVTVHSAPLCGESNFETIEAAGSCLRGYFTVPAMLATLQVTRAPWVERPLVTRSILSAVGIAFAIDSYDPVEREAFPIAGHIGAFVQDLGDERIGILSYLGVAPTVPILGEGGNTTSIGLLGGVGIEYITSANGPDEGFKPAAFVSVIVQIGQANPAASGGGQAFGAYAPPPQG
ncbi:MAG: hypothetical protein DRI90_20265, partial [Deltaproteobacteria bacterium]